MRMTISLLLAVLAGVGAAEAQVVQPRPHPRTEVRIAVAGTVARLYVHGADQPVLIVIVRHMKLAESAGQVGLWLHTSTLAHFRDLKISSAEQGS